MFPLRNISLFRTLKHRTFNLGEPRSTVRYCSSALRARDPVQESPELKECFRLLNLTSQTFPTIIKNLHSELRIPVCLNYLILRGLDSIEDDMTIDIQEKEPLLRNFHKVIHDESWTYDGKCLREKDRDVLVNFNVVTKEFNKIKREYQIIIKDVTKRMGKGMADYAKAAEYLQESIQTVEGYKMYCYCVAGLAGESVMRLAVQANLEDPEILKKPKLIDSLWQFHQQIHTIKSFSEEFENKRCFWPKEVWSKYVNKLPDLILPENKQKALQCQSELVSIALQNVDQILSFLSCLKEPSVFRINAIPYICSLATLELCFQNYSVFERNIDIARATASDLMMRCSQDFQLFCRTYCEYVRKIRQKNRPQDPSFLDINTVCCQIENRIESMFPTQKTNA